MLLEGITRFGCGNWKQILPSYKFHDKRTNVDPKDKYRNILSKIHTGQKSRANSTHLVGTSHLGGSGVHHAETHWNHIESCGEDSAPLLPPFSDILRSPKPPITGSSVQPGLLLERSGSLSEAPIILPSIQKHCEAPISGAIKKEVLQRALSSACCGAHAVSPLRIYYLENKKCRASVYARKCLRSQCSRTKSLL